MAEESLDIVNELNISNELKCENERLNKQIADNSVGVNGLLAQIDAYRQQLNEIMQVSINLRTNCILLQKHNSELSEKLKVEESLNQ